MIIFGVSKMNKLVPVGVTVLNKPFRKSIKGGKLFQFSTPGHIQVLHENGTYRSFHAPKNFICDSTSLFYAVDVAGDFHDVFYAIQDQADGQNRAYWDRLYYLLMLELGFNKYQAMIRFAGVRIFGGWAYRTRRLEKYHAIKMLSISTHILKTELK
jgi:hypothetical protein